MIDALQCGHFDRSIFVRLKQGGFTCVTATLGFWEGTLASMDAIGRWRKLERENGDLIVIARNVADIRSAAESGRVAILCGYQNTELFDGRAAFVELFAELGVRIVQLTYNNQNEVGGSCYELHDNGLGRYGRELIPLMNRHGIVVDLSHVGEKTSLDAIELSEKPVAITHANAQALLPHNRNKSNDVLKALAAKGGVIGCAVYRNITPESACATVDGWCEMMARTVDIAGIDHVGIGTDVGHNNGQADLDWMRQGYWTLGVDYGAGSAARPGPVPAPDWLPSIERLAAVRDGLSRAGFNAEEAEKLLSGNWLRLYEEVFG